MLVRVPPSWQLPESQVVSEAEWAARPRPGIGRRRFLRGLAGGVAGLGALPLAAAVGGLPGKPNPAYQPEGLDPTPEELVTGYNNFYEFGLQKDEPKVLANRGWKTAPWRVRVDGLVRNPLDLDVEDLIRKIGGLEQRLYRFRCVEAWSMVIPWDGFPLRKLVDLVEPTSEATHVRFVTFLDPESAPMQRTDALDWPYEEGLTIDEARHDLTLLATGIFGKPMPNQNGAPIRLVVPWKYGFKSIKSIVRIEFVSSMPSTTWSARAPDEYGFYANVNPSVDHPRWSQASERVIGGGFFGGRQQTLLFNGYAKEVAGLYRGLDLRRFY